MLGQEKEEIYCRHENENQHKNDEPEIQNSLEIFMTSLGYCFNSGMPASGLLQDIKINPSIFKCSYSGFLNM